jgi:hypothetical protein
MADCTTLDLLLVGWLYDELEPAEAARFTRHLDDCEACWHTAQSLIRLRALMRELPAEAPPEAASTRILHQASEHVAGTRRRPWAWLAGWLELAWAHPAAAALATMVLVAGVAGALFTRGRLETAAPSSSRSATLAQLQGGDAPVTGEPTASGDGIHAPAAPAPVMVHESEKRATAPGEAGAARGPASGARGQVRRDGAATAAEDRKRLEATSQRLAPDLAPVPTVRSMELAGDDESDPLNEQQQVSAMAGAAQERVEAAGDPGAGRPAGAAPAPAPSANRGESDRAQPRQAAPKQGERTWAETRHDALRTALRQQECARATRIADDIRARDPGYYRARIAAGKDLADCRQPADARRQAAEKKANDAN